MDEQRIIRDRHEAIAAELDRQDWPAPNNPTAIVVRVIDAGAIPTKIPPKGGKYFACVAIDPGGPEVAGGKATLTARPGTLYVLVVGKRVPEVDDYLVARSINGRLVASGGHIRDKGTCSDCNQIPATLSFTAGDAPPIVLTWQATPSLIGATISLATVSNVAGSAVFAMPAEAWFGPTTPFIANSGTPNAYPASLTLWIAFQGCKCYLFQVYDVTHSPTYLPGEPPCAAVLTVYSYVPPSNAVPLTDCDNTCNPFVLRDWYLQSLDGFGTVIHISCAFYEVRGEGTDLVPLDSTGSAGNLGDVIP